MSEYNIVKIFSSTAARYAQKAAIERGGEEVSYADLEKRSNQLANYLQAEGPNSGAMIAIMSDDVIQIIIALLAVLKAGGIFAPLDLRLPARRLATILSSLKPDWFLLDSTFVSIAHEAGSQLESRPRVIVMDGAAAAAAATPQPWNCVLTSVDASNRTVDRPPDDMCYVYFTSGSTGSPKGIAGRLKAIAHFIQWEIEALGVDSNARVSQFAPPSFDAFLKDVFVPLCAGGTVCLPADKSLVLDGGALVDWIDSRGLTLVHCVPSLFRLIVNEPLTADRFRSLKHVVLAGEALLPADVKRWVNVFGDRVQLVNLYGPTETTLIKLFYLVKPSDGDAKFIPIGKPIAGARAVILDEKRRACPTGTVGEIYIRTPYRSLGYLNEPKATDEAFVRNPFSNDPQDIVYNTGDLGRVLDDGNLQFLGRKDLQVKVRGFRIELSEIEHALRLLNTVKDAAVVAQELVPGDKTLCAYVVLDEEATTGEVKAHASQYLPDYMTPSVFVVMDELPRTLTGKIDRRALPVPRGGLAGDATSLVPPRTPIETTLVNLWKDVLGMKHIGITNNFFDVGGHSLKATGLLARVRAKFGVDLRLQEFFEEPTIEGMAERLTRALVEHVDQARFDEAMAAVDQLGEDEAQAIIAEDQDRHQASEGRR
jgi:amino acid adenylation domain-containing protein